MSGIVGAAYDEDGNYVEDIVVSEPPSMYYVAEPLSSYDTSVVVDYYAVPYDTSVVATASVYYDITEPVVDVSVSGIQGPMGEEE